MRVSTGGDTRDMGGNWICFLCWQTTENRRVSTGGTQKMRGGDYTCFLYRQTTDNRRVSTRATQKTWRGLDLFSTKMLEKSTTSETAQVV